jgi:hypothetical protein
MSSMNQRPCWDDEDMLGWGKAPGRDEASALWTLSLWKAPPHHDLLKEQPGHCPPGPHPTSVPSHHSARPQSSRPAKPPSASPPGCCPCCTVVHHPPGLHPAGPLGSCHTGLLGCHSTGPLPHRSVGPLPTHCPSQEGSDTTRRQLQTT